MSTLLDCQKPALEALGDNKVEASLTLHRSKLAKITDKAVEIIDASLPDATLKDVISAYDVTRKHLNIIDGRAEFTTVNVFIPPPELQAHYSLADEIKAQIIEDTKKQCQSSNSTKPKRLSRRIPTVSES